MLSFRTIEAYIIRSDHLKLIYAVQHPSDIQTAQEHNDDIKINPSREKLRASVPIAYELISPLPLCLIVFVINSLCRDISLVNNTAN